MYVLNALFTKILFRKSGVFWNYRVKFAIRPRFLANRYRKQTISFFMPYIIIFCLGRVLRFFIGTISMVTTCWECQLCISMMDGFMIGRYWVVFISPQLFLCPTGCRTCIYRVTCFSLWISSTSELGYDGPLYDRFLHMTDDMLGPSPMHIKYLSYVYDRFCIWRTNFPDPIESVVSKFSCIVIFCQL